MNNAASLRHMDHTYTWYDTNAAINGGNAGTVGAAATCNSTLPQCNTSAFVAAVNAQGLCGANDWRMPTPQELQGIVHYGSYSPVIDPGYFPNTSLSANAFAAGRERAMRPTRSALGPCMCQCNETAVDGNLLSHLVVDGIVLRG